jgi:hypothetical protein
MLVLEIALPPRRVNSLRAGSKTYARRPLQEIELLRRLLHSRIRTMEPSLFSNSARETPLTK